MEGFKTPFLIKLRILTGKQQIQRKLKDTGKVWILHFSKFIYKSHYFLKVLLNLIGLSESFLVFWNKSLFAMYLFWTSFFNDLELDLG